MNRITVTVQLGSALKHVPTTANTTFVRTGGRGCGRATGSDTWVGTGPGTFEMLAVIRTLYSKDFYLFSWAGLNIPLGLF